MANAEQLSVLMQGVGPWNEWRKDHSDTMIDLSEANLRGFTLAEIDLIASDLTGADLSSVDFNSALLNGANLSGTKLLRTNFGNASLSNSNFAGAIFGGTVFANSDLSKALGLDTANHIAPSDVSTRVFTLSKGILPSVFLRGCGLSDWEIELVKLYDPGYSNEEINQIMHKMYDICTCQSLQVSPLFISYSRADHVFVDKLEDLFNVAGIRFWRDIHDMKAGRIETQIDLAIRQNPTVLLVLSEHSLSSDWVELEVRTARQLEKEMRRDVMCPVALDNSWRSSHWPKRLMEQIAEYNILDFSEWRDDSKFDATFRKLIDGLELFYKG